MNLFRSIKEWIGVLLIDFPRYIYLTTNNKLGWTKLCNRAERVSECPNGVGVLCNWKWSSNLHAPSILPLLGKLLMRRALSSFPIKLSDTSPERNAGNPDVSFIIGHRGRERLPHLLLTLKSIAAQESLSFECIVVEQSSTQSIQADLPPWVHYYHDYTSSTLYNRARTFNVAFNIAKGKLLILHDNDMLIPTHYGKDMLD